jgi:RNA polymerase sigma factor (sigma-70 family)
MNNLTDIELIKSARKGSNEAFRQLVLRYQQVVFAAAFGVTKNSADAEDAAQESFIRFHKHINQFDTSRPFKPWLLTIVMNCSRSIIKKNQRLQALGDNETLIETESVESPVADISKSEKRMAIRDLVAQLPDSMREVCSLFYLAQCTCKEISSILNLSESNVKVNLHRSRKKLLENGIGQWRTT